MVAQLPRSRTPQSIQLSVMELRESPTEFPITMEVITQLTLGPTIKLLAEVPLVIAALKFTRIFREWFGQVAVFTEKTERACTALNAKMDLSHLEINIQLSAVTLITAEFMEF